MKRWLVLLATLLLARFATGQGAHLYSLPQAPGPSLPILMTSTTVAPESTSPGYTLRASVREVRVDFSVADSHGRAMARLTPDDVEVFDEGARQQIHGFTSDSTLPLRIVFLFDASESTSPMLRT